MEQIGNYIEGIINGVMPDRYGACISVKHDNGTEFFTLEKKGSKLTAREILDIFNVDDFGEMKGQILQLRPTGVVAGPNKYELVI